MKLYAIMSDEGIVATLLPGIGASPMVTISEKHKDKFVETAREIATLTNTRLEVREFEVHKVLEVIEP